MSSVRCRGSLTRILFYNMHLILKFQSANVPNDLYFMDTLFCHYFVTLFYASLVNVLRCSSKEVCSYSMYSNTGIQWCTSIRYRGGVIYNPQHCFNRQCQTLMSSPGQSSEL